MKIFPKKLPHPVEFAWTTANTNQETVRTPVVHKDIIQADSLKNRAQFQFLKSEKKSLTTISLNKDTTRLKKELGYFEERKSWALHL
jgi:hypothetical protein